MNAIITNIDEKNKLYEYFEDYSLRILLDELRKNKNNTTDQQIRKHGVYLFILRNNKKYFLLVNETTNIKDAKYISKHFINAIESACKFHDIQNETYDTAEKIVLHNTKNINNSINLKLLAILNSENLHKADNKIEFISKLIENKYTDYPRELLNIYKFSNQIQFEYTILLWLGTNANTENLSISKHNIYKVIELAKFVTEDSLNKNKISLEIEKTTREITCDFDIFKSCLSQIFENCSKYCRPRSVVEISYSFTSTTAIIDISMESLYHDDSEIENIFLPGVRGKQVIDNGYKGSGLGLYIVQKLLSICNIDIKFFKLPSAKVYPSNGQQYTNNLFVITIPN